jgi:hypothetical protein
MILLNIFVSRSDAKSNSKRLAILTWLAKKWKICLKTQSNKLAKLALAIFH